MAKYGTPRQIIDAQVHSETQRVDEADTNTRYIGFSRVDNAEDEQPVWRIKRVTVSGNITTVRVAGDGTYRFKWNERTTLNY